jgi:two-component system, OmpR family, alkaline phosphatase synthesis response regulator PhoP
MDSASILVVDNEEQVRRSLQRSLEALRMPIRTAASGEEALQRLREAPYRIIFLDLHMPGEDTRDVLRQIKDEWPKTRVVMITAHGTVESAVEAMKLGAVDFVQKPLDPDEICNLARSILEREELDEETADYPRLIELTKRHITDKAFATARETARKAIGADPGRPEAFNLLGALLEIDGDWLEAEKYYRASTDLDPTFRSAWANLERLTSMDKSGDVDLGDEGEESSKRSR